MTKQGKRSIWTNLGPQALLTVQTSHARPRDFPKQANIEMEAPIALNPRMAQVLRKASGNPRHQTPKAPAGKAPKESKRLAQHLLRDPASGVSKLSEARKPLGGILKKKSLARKPGCKHLRHRSHLKGVAPECAKM